MKRIILAVLLLACSSASAENTCDATAKQERFHTRVERGRYCMNLTIYFPWGSCRVKPCWSGSKNYPLTARGTACGTRVFCVRQGRGPRYACRY